MLTAWAACVGADAAAQENPLPSASQLEATRTLLENVELKLEGRTTSTHSELGEAIRQASGQRTRLSQCVSYAQRELNRITGSLAAYGDSPPTDSPLAAEYRELEAQGGQFEERLAQCRVLLLRVDDDIKRLTALQNQLLRARLIAQGPNIIVLTLEVLEDPGEVIDVLRGVASELIEGLPTTPQSLTTAGFAVVLGSLIALWLRRQLLARLPAEPPETSLPYAFARTLAGYLVPLGAALVATAYLGGGDFQPPWGVTPAALVALGILVYVAAVIAFRSVLAPPRPGRQSTGLPDSKARTLCRRLLVLITVILIGAVGYGLLPAERFTEPGFALLRSVYLSFLTINLGWSIWIFGFTKARARAARRLRLALLVPLTIVLAAEAVGYRNLAGYLITGLLLSMMACMVFWVVDRGLGAFFDTLEAGRYRWQQSLKQRLALAADAPIPGLIWLRLLSTAFTWGTLGLALLRIWGLSDAGTALIIRYLVDGFTVSETTIVPFKLLTGIAFFAVLLAVLGVFRDALEKRWLNRTRLDAGARETLVAITSYIGFTIAVLIGLSLAGFNLQNLALIAGALSVGIGFGLQNVVSNFVSGIILLFERPVRPGDWVVVGATEGYVKKVRVRSTEILTFDRSDVIVPNSEFISAQVTNWTLRDPYGRIIVPVGVGYASDPELVRDIMLEAASQHPRIMQGGLVPAPKVLFRSFGDSALLFELRCFIRDINYKIDTISDLNYTITRLFRERGIEIPFPQRDLHLKSWPANLVPMPPDSEQEPPARESGSDSGTTEAGPHR